jgi:hypothetical protein
MKIMQISSDSIVKTVATIEGINEACIDAYFMYLNHGEFSAAADLFAPQGYLQPPFDQIIQGREMIAAYLEKETKGMKFCPESGKKLVNNSENAQFDIQGKVQTDFFTFNVTWLVQLSLTKEIVAMEVKLLDSIGKLLNFNHVL